MADLYDDIHLVLENLAQKGPEVESNALKDSIEYVNTIEQQATNMDPSTAWGKIFKEFIGHIARNTEFSLKQRLNKVTGKPFINYTKESYLAKTKKILVQAKNHLINNLLKDKKDLIKDSTDIIRLADKFVTEVKNIKSSSPINKFIGEGANIIARKIAAFIYNLRKSAQN